MSVQRPSDQINAATAVVRARKSQPIYDPLSDRTAVFDALDGKHGDDQRAIAEQGLAVVAMLLEKNRSYGSSAFDPIRVFAKGLSALDQIHVRMDDKLSRLARGHAIDGEDTIYDLAGYCVLELVARRRSVNAAGSGA